MKKNHLPNIL